MQVFPPIPLLLDFVKKPSELPWLEEECWLGDNQVATVCEEVVS